MPEIEYSFFLWILMLRSYYRNISQLPLLFRKKLKSKWKTYSVRLYFCIRIKKMFFDTPKWYEQNYSYYSLIALLNSRIRFYFEQRASSSFVANKNVRLLIFRERINTKWFHFVILWDHRVQKLEVQQQYRY